MYFSNKLYYVNPLKKKKKLMEDLQMLMPSRSLSTICGHTQIQNRCWVQDSETKFLLLEL